MRVRNRVLTRGALILFAMCGLAIRANGGLGLDADKIAQAAGSKATTTKDGGHESW